MTYWTEDRTKRLLELRAQGLEMLAIAARLGDGCTKNMVCGKLSRLDGRAQQSASNNRRKPHVRQYTTFVRGDWDAQLFEPYHVRKQRLAAERDNVQR